MSFTKEDVERWSDAHVTPLFPGRPTYRAVLHGDCGLPYTPSAPPPEHHVTIMTLDDPGDWPPHDDHSESYRDQAGHTWYTRARTGRRLHVPTRASWVDRRRSEHLRLVLADPTFGDPCKSCGKHLKGRGLVAVDWQVANVTIRVRRGTLYGARMHLYRVHGVGRPL